jgi:hypothetical protein
MPQRYITTETMAGVNLYQSYATTGYPTVPSALAELGLNPGLRANGSNNTQWLFCNTNTASPVVTAGTAVPINATTFLVQVGTSTLNGTSLVSNPVNVPGGMWFEISGATLNLTPLSLSEAQEALDATTKAVADAQAAEAKAKADLDAVKGVHAADPHAPAKNATTKAHP